MLKQRSGHVVNISASIADRADSVEPTALTALTKGGLAAVTKSLAVEYASRGIRVNAVAPGIIQTPLQPADYTPEALTGKLPPLGRAGLVSDIVGGIRPRVSAVRHRRGPAHRRRPTLSRPTPAELALPMAGHCGGVSRCGVPFPITCPQANVGPGPEQQMSTWPSDGTSSGSGEHETA